MHGVFQRLQIRQRIGAGHGLYAAHTGGNTAFGDDFEQPDVTGATHVGAAAEFFARTDAQHANGLAVLLTEQHHGAGFLCSREVHHGGVGGRVGQNFGVHTHFNFADLRVGHRRVVREVKARALGVHQAAFLLHVLAQHFAQSLVHEVGGAVVAHSGSAHTGVNPGGDSVSDLERATGERAMVAEHIGLDFERVVHREHSTRRQQLALVAHLAAALCIKRCGAQHHDAILAGLKRGHRHALSIKRKHLGRLFEQFVAGEGMALAAVVERAVHLELAGRSGLAFLLVHGQGKAGFVHAQAALAANVGR